MAPSLPPPGDLGATDHPDIRILPQSVHLSAFVATDPYLCPRASHHLLDAHHKTINEVPRFTEAMVDGGLACPWCVAKQRLVAP